MTRVPRPTDDLRPTPVVASVAVADVLAGAPREATVVAAGRYAAYLDVGGTALAVTTVGASRLPCALRLPPDAAAPDRTWRPGEPVLVGDRRVRGTRGVLAVARWWSPAPALRDVDAAGLPAWRAGVATAARAAGASGGLAGDATAGAALDGLAAALRAVDGPAAAAAADGLLGRGPGSTPAGDDVLAGLLVTLRLLRHVDARAAVLWAGPGSALARRVRVAAPARTAWLSAALLGYAAAGQPLGELADVLVAAPRTGQRPADAGPAVARLLAVGHTSGADLLAGLLLAAAALTAAPPARDPAGRDPAGRVPVPTTGPAGPPRQHPEVLA